jgi:hypothetical protein
MAVKTFAVGEVLTASDTNTYLNNGGLVYITSTTIGSAVSSVTVSNVFSSTYDNYLIQIYGYSTSVDSVMWMTINGSAGTTYQSIGYYMTYGSATLNGSGAAATASGFRLAENASAGGGSITVNLYRPNVVSVTTFDSVSQNLTYGNRYQGKDTNAASSTGFTLTPSSGTISSGNIYIYGIRKV